MTEKANDVIFVGNKPPMSYVLAIMTSLSAGNLKEITLKARGQAITTAVDVAEIARNRSLKTSKLARLLSEQLRCHLVRERASPEWFQRWR
jgi:DNA-binding protein Alba